MTHPTDEKQTHQAVAADIARELREHPALWMQGHLVRFREHAGFSDLVLRARDARAECWCLIGHICKRLPDPDDSMACRMLFEQHVGTFELAAWNDTPGRTAQDVVALCDEVAAS